MAAEKLTALVKKLAGPNQRRKKRTEIFIQAGGNAEKVEENPSLGAYSSDTKKNFAIWLNGLLKLRATAYIYT